MEAHMTQPEEDALTEKEYRRKMRREEAQKRIHRAGARREIDFLISKMEKPPVQKVRAGKSSVPVEKWDHMKVILKGKSR